MTATMSIIQLRFIDIPPFGDTVVQAQVKKRYIYSG